MVTISGNRLRLVIIIAGCLTTRTVEANTLPGSAVKPRQNLQQLQIAVVLPPGTQPGLENQPLSPPKPGYVWVQLPASLVPQKKPANQTADPPIIPPSVTDYPPYFPSSVVDVFVPTTTTAPIYSSPVPSVEYDSGFLLKRCLSPRGQFPSPFCNKYVNCWDGTAVDQFCPDGLLFNSRGYCDYPANVNCGGRPVAAPPLASNTDNTVSGQFSEPTPIQVPTTSSPPTVIVSLPTVDPNLRKRCLTPRGQFRGSSCNKFVNCWDDVVLEQECPEGLLFSSKGYCDYSYNVNCADGSLPPQSSYTGSYSPRYICPLELGTFRDETDCGKYYTCIGGQIVANYSCPLPDFKFSVKLGVCDWADRVDCTEKAPIFDPKASFLQNISQDLMKKINDCEPGTVFSLNQQCTSVCLCRDGVSEVVQCPSGLAYDIKSDKCVLPHLAKC